LLPQSLYVFGAVEGAVDETVLRCLLGEVHVQPVAVHGKHGKPHLKRGIAGYNHAARHDTWIVLVDLNHEASCAPQMKAAWLPHPAPTMLFCVAVREVEAWLLADRERMARFLGVPQSLVPFQPEQESDPKQTVVNLARRSHKRAIREDMVPRVESGRAVGPAYTSRLIEFVTDRLRGWRPNVASQRSPSLQRCIQRLRQIALPSP